MTSSRWRFGITLAFLGLASILPGTVEAQPPTYLTQWGTFGGGSGQFAYPAGVATDAAGNVYVVDTFNQRIQKFTGSGTYLTQWGSLGSGDGQFNEPRRVATDAAGNVYVGDTQNHRVQKFTSTGTYVTQWGSYGSGDGQFASPAGVATDAAGNVYVADHGNYRIQKFTSTGAYLTQWGSFGIGDGQFEAGISVATDPTGHVYVADAFQYRVQKFAGTGAYLTQWGSDGTGDGQFTSPRGVATDPAGNVYVADLSTNRIQKFTGTGDYLTQWGSTGSGDGQFAGASDVAVDATGDIYVVDSGNHRIQKFRPAPTPIAMGFDFKPHDLNLNSHGKWVTGLLRPPAPLLASQIDVTSIRLNGVVAVAAGQPAKIEDHDTRLKVKFVRADVAPTLTPGDHVPVTVTGMISGQPFTGADDIKVKAPKIHHPAPGEIVAAGATTEVTWDLPDMPAPAVTLMSSFDDGVTWKIEAEGIANTGRTIWTAPNVATTHARLAVQTIYGVDETGVVPESEFAVSDPFSIIAATTGVAGGRAAFALRSSSPAIGPMTVNFSLASGARATLSLYDVRGRQVDSREVGSGGPGWHTVQLGDRGELPAGLYLVRLTQEKQTLTTRVAMLH